MSVYYVSHPEFALKAKVDAPSTDKARTTYLDYMERTGVVPRTSRQEIRRGIATKRLGDPSEFLADIELDYGYGDIGQMGSIPQLSEGPQAAVPEFLPQEQEQAQPEPMQAYPQIKRSPIAMAMLKSMGVQ